MFARKSLNSSVQKIHLRSLRVFHSTYGTTYDELLPINSNVSIDQRYLYFLVTEVFKSVNKLNPHFMWDYFKMIFFAYDLRKVNTLNLPPAQSTRHGINSLSLLGSLFWNNLPREIKEKTEGTRRASVFMYSLSIRNLLIMVTLLDKVSTAQLQDIYK